MRSYLLSGIALILLLGAGVAMIRKVRGWYRGSGVESDDWEQALAKYRNLRNEGVLSEEEYRKIRTLVESGRSGRWPQDAIAHHAHRSVEAGGEGGPGGDAGLASAPKKT